MNTTHDDNATTWRELADQLTDRQRFQLERAEQEFTDRGAVPTALAAGHLLEFARDYVEGNLVDSAYSDVPVPTGATWVGDWEKNLKRDGWSRVLLWRKFGDSEMSVDIDGRQQCDGDYTRQISAWTLEDVASLTSAGARQLAALLIEAADELDRLSG